MGIDWRSFHLIQCFHAFLGIAIIDWFFQVGWYIIYGYYLLILCIVECWLILWLSFSYGFKKDDYLLSIRIYLDGKIVLNEVMLWSIVPYLGSSNSFLPPFLTFFSASSKKCVLDKTFGYIIFLIDLGFRCIQPHVA